MQKNWGAVLLCVALGAGGMWVASNYKLKFEANGSADAPPAKPDAAKGEPDKLPAHLKGEPLTDGKVRQAQNVEGAAAVAGGGAGAVESTRAAVAANKLVVKEVADGLQGSDVRLLPNPPALEPLRLSSTNLKMTFEFQDKAAGDDVAFLVSVEGNKTEEVPSSKYDKTTGRVTLTLDLSPEKKYDPAKRITVRATRKVAGTADVTVGVVFPGRQTPDQEWQLELPSAPAAEVQGVWNGVYAAEQPKPDGDGPRTIDLYTGRYARMVAKAGQVGGRYEFLLYDAASPRNVIATGTIAEQRPVGDGLQFTLNWSKPVPATTANKPYQLVVREKFDTSHADAVLAVNVTAAPTPPKVVLGAITGAVESGDVLLIGRKVITLPLTVTPAGSGGGKLLLFVDRPVEGQPKQDGTADVPANAGDVSFAKVNLGTNGRHLVRVAFEAGGKLDVLVSAEFDVRAGGLEVIRVSPTDFSAAPDGKVRVRFQPENPVAENVGKNKDFYSLVLSEPLAPLVDDKKQAVTATPGEMIAGVSFEKATNSATLSLRTPIPPGQYTLTVKAAISDGTLGIKDIYGNPLGGVAGAAGAEFTTTLVQPVGGALPSQSAGVTFGTGPNVTFPEYTRFRHVPEGANPSDRVETRVVRLYYSRDAHRIAQIVNRDVKSYNAAGVDVRRRAADRARDDADLTQDERQKLEREAVQASVEARAAETRLRELQSRLVTAQNEAATAKSQGGQRQLQLDQFLRTAGRDRRDITTRQETDTGSDAAQRRVDLIGQDIARLQRTLNVASADGGTITEATTAAEIDRQVQKAQTDLGTAQRALAQAFNTARADVEANDRDVILAKKTVDNLVTARSTATPAQLAVLDAQLFDARQVLAATTEKAILARPNLADDIQKKTDAVQTAERGLNRKIAGGQAVADLVVQNQALTDAKWELTRAQARARGRGDTDTGADSSADTAAALRAEISQLNAVSASTDATVRSLQEQITQTTASVQGLRTTEVRANELALSRDRQELRKRQEQFRREVSAASADPDTYAAGLPESDDPVRQCSISVIGEGLIQLRGPVKGLNVIRTMINQMDAPTGQVRVGVHTVQVNGERQEKMDKVVANIQRYLDHSRFLTTQSAQMLRKAVTAVASRKAEEAAATVAPGCSRADQEAKYLHAFFGKEFIDELRQLDSEFLRTGNKLLSLHSMDSTSLASALFLLALAKNDVRGEILAEFQAQLKTKLPQAEADFYLAGLSCADKCEACADKKFCVLAQNARFTSFFGFFDGEVRGADTLNPAQREFVKLAQIFKARLVTELELKQRVLERTLLEERIGRKYLEMLREADELERTARTTLDQVRKSFDAARLQTAAELAVMEGPFAQVEAAFDQFDAGGLRKQFEEVERSSSAKAAAAGDAGLPLPIGPIAFFNNNKPFNIVARKLNGREFEVELVGPEWVNELTWRMDDIDKVLGDFRIQKDRAAADHVKKLLDDFRKSANPKRTFTLTELKDLEANLSEVRNGVLASLAVARETTKKLMHALADKGFDVGKAVELFTRLKALGLKLNPSSDTAKLTKQVFDKLDRRFTALTDEAGRYATAYAAAAAARRPLDEKKLLDMLVDDMEDKHIELLDGTRAHTANVDNYLKAIATALEDDFNTQFYAPAFRKVRTLGAGRDVTLGQIESTTVLTNNRVLGKVSPTASMEFDLPKRDIAIREAFKGAKAAVQEYGALLNDPVFLSMVKLYGGGGSPAALYGGAGGGLPAVRNVFPGLPSSADEMLYAQAGSPRREFGTHLESLIPDPSVYKFETGVGYEIRPVLSPDGQAVVFGFDYMYTTDVREPVRADEKHLGRVKRHFVHTDVQLGNYELREVSQYRVGLKAARTGQGVQLLQDIPLAGNLFRPAASAGSSLQQNLIYSQAAIFPTLFDLMGLRYAAAVADLDPDVTRNDEFVVRGRQAYLRQFIFDYGASRVDDALRILYGERRPDLYRAQHSIPWVHPNGYQGPGLRQRDAELQEGYDPTRSYPPTRFAPGMRLPLDARDPADGNPPFDPRLTPPNFTPPTGYPIPGGTTSRGPAIPPPAKEYGATPLGTTVTREPTRTPLPAAPLRAPAPPPVPFGVPTVLPPVSRGAPPDDPKPARRGPTVFEPAPLAGRGSGGNPFLPR